MFIALQIFLYAKSIMLGILENPKNSDTQKVTVIILKFDK